MQGDMEVLIKSSTDDDTETMFVGNIESCKIFIRGFQEALMSTGLYRSEYNEKDKVLILTPDDPEMVRFQIWIGLSLPMSLYATNRSNQ